MDSIAVFGADHICLEGGALVEKLRTDELRSIETNVKADLRSQVLKSLDERGRAQDLIRQQYTSRYPFELLQNANDAAADAEGGNVVFAVTDSALIVADQGAGFGPTQIEAVCRLGRSSKDPRKSIGYKGLGFKSVGEISDSPQIFSEAVSFGFDAAKTRSAVEHLVGELNASQKLPVYAFPFDLAPEDAASDAGMVKGLREQRFRTVLRFPFKTEVSRDAVEKHVRETVTARLLLFLDATDGLKVTGTGLDFWASVARQKTGSCTETLLQTGDELEHWLVFRRTLDQLDRALVDPLGDAWKTVTAVHVAAAIRLDANGRPCRAKSEPLHVYFPTEEETGLPLALHGDFALELDRRHVGKSPETLPYNQWLAGELAALVADVAERLAKEHPGHAGVVECLAPVSQGSGFGQYVRDECIKRLRTARFVPTIGAGVVAPTQATMLPAALVDKASAHRHVDLSGMPVLVTADVETDAGSRSLLLSLGASESRSDDVLGLLKEPQLSNDAEFYEFLVAWGDKHGRQFGAKLNKVQCVRTLGGGWLSPDANVYFPRQRDAIQFPHGIQVPIAATPEVEGLRALLEAAGVRAFEWRQLIPDFVLPLLTDHGNDGQTRSIAFAALRAYYDQERTGDPRIRAQIAQVLLPSRAASGTDEGMAPAGSLYFSQAWLAHSRLEKIYGPFGKSEFLALQPPSAETKLQEQAFLAWIGVADYPRIDEKRAEQREAFALDNLSRHPHSAYGAAWMAWQQTEIAPNKSCDQGHSNSHLRSSYCLDRLPELVASRDSQRLASLWKEICDHWAVYEPAMRSELQCVHGWHMGSSVRTVPSLLHHLLQTLEWVPSVRAKAATLEVPQRTWRVTIDTPRQIIERVTALDPALDIAGSASLLAFLGVIDAARPAPSSLVDLLESLADAFDTRPENEEEDRSLVLAARWAMRTLNDVMHSDASPGPVRLLARFNGKRIFTDRPFVALNPLLGETWEPVFPILDADLDLRKLHTALCLRVLDDEIVTKPDPRALREDIRGQTELYIDKAKPYLAAVAIDQVPSRHAQVIRNLGRLEVIVCDRLVLRYELDGEVREREDAVAYIATRVEQEGSTRRTTGTAHLELDPSTGQPYWYALGPQLALFLGVPTMGDAFSLILAGQKADRQQFLASKRITTEAIDEARLELAQAPEAEEIADLLSVRPVINPEVSALAPPIVQPGQAQPEVGQSGTPSSPAPEPTPPLAEISFPAIEHEAVRVEDAPPAQPSDSKSGGESIRRPGLGPQEPIDHERQHRIRILIGARGEEAAYEAERRRLAAAGRDPGAVVWRSKAHPLAPYDIESLDDDGQRIYIDVKATTGDDPHDAFEISEGELLIAIAKRSSYFIYRVTAAHTAQPIITRFRDPIGRVQDNSASLRLSGAKMHFNG